MYASSNLKAGVIGYGSIGSRHCENLRLLGVEDITLFREHGKGNLQGLREIYDKELFFSSDYDFIILSNPTALHFAYLQCLIPRQVNLLAEKPLVATRDEYEKLKTLLANYKGIGMCAYNLRFHPCVMKADEIISGHMLGKIYAARFFVGQYLPDWRPGTDYRKSYSAIQKLGGGVILDLIHEIDLAAHFCGSVKDKFHSLVDKISGLEIETEDLAEMHYRSAGGAFVSIHQDYLVRGYSRHFEIIGEKARIHADLAENRLQLIGDRNEILADHLFTDFNRNDMYLALMSHFLKSILDNTKPRPSLEEGLVSMETALRAKSIQL